MKVSAPKQEVDPNIALSREREEKRLRVKTEELNRAQQEDERRRRAGLYGRNSLQMNGSRGFIIGNNQTIGG